MSDIDMFETNSFIVPLGQFLQFRGKSRILACCIYHYILIKIRLLYKQYVMKIISRLTLVVSLT